MQFIKINLLFLLLNNGLLVSLSNAQQSSAADVANAMTANSPTAQRNAAAKAAAPTAALTQAAEGGSTEKLLSRKRRYLLFPEGSSFQLVYDEIIGIVDYTNYLILGITVALAWELPSKPPSEQLEDLRTRLKDGTLGLSRNDTITGIKYEDHDEESRVTTPPVPLPLPKAVPLETNLRVAPFQVPMHPSFYWHSGTKEAQSDDTQTLRYEPAHSASSSSSSSATYGRRNYRPSIHNPYYYYGKRRKSFQQQSGNNNPATGIAAKYPWWNLTNRLSNSWMEKAQQQRPSADGSNPTAIRKKGKHPQKGQQDNGYNQSTSAHRKKHRIFPVFGKRSAAALENVVFTSSSAAATNTAAIHTVPPHQRVQRDYFVPRHGIADRQLNKQDHLHVRHHRKTRQTLYEKIEIYLDKRGSHGQHCVLRALCETGQKSHEREPGSFVAELMRTIFTLPEALEPHEAPPRLPLEQTQHKRSRHYDAASAYAGDCATRYQHCKHSLWTSEFVA